VEKKKEWFIWDVSFDSMGISDAVHNSFCYRRAASSSFPHLITDLYIPPTYLHRPYTPYINTFIWNVHTEVKREEKKLSWNSGKCEKCCKLTHTYLCTDDLWRKRIWWLYVECLQRFVKSIIDFLKTFFRTSKKWEKRLPVENIGCQILY
jgi:hypothetical protein